jgi:hypothetical protein
MPDLTAAADVAELPHARQSEQLGRQSGDFSVAASETLRKLSDTQSAQ